MNFLSLPNWLPQSWLVRVTILLGLLSFDFSVGHIDALVNERQYSQATQDGRFLGDARLFSIHTVTGWSSALDKEAGREKERARKKTIIARRSARVNGHIHPACLLF